MVNTELFLQYPKVKSINPFGSKLEICTDSRKYKTGNFFVALSGESFDGAKFSENVYKKGCRHFVLTNTSENEQRAIRLKDASIYLVDDTLDFIQWLAKAHIDSLNKKFEVICITGSNGKTTTKEMLYHILDSVKPGRIHKNFKNFNNHIGVPLTLLEVSKEKDVLVVEIGTNHPGEIKTLCEIARPNIGYITNIGESHMEFFKTRENVFKEKKELFNYLETHQGNFLVNEHDPFLKDLCGKGREQLGELIFNNNSVELGGSTLINDNLMGEYNFINLAAAYKIAQGIYPNLKDELIKAAKSFKPDNNRSTWDKFLDKDIYLDCYNANPTSMKVSLKAFMDFVNSKQIKHEQVLLVLGEMGELGEDAPKYHQEVAEFVQSFFRGNILYFGNYSEIFSDIIGAQRVESYQSVDLLPEFNTHKWVKASQFIFFKASRSLQLESLLGI